MISDPLFAQAKVSDAHVTVLIQQHVLRFEITVNDALKQGQKGRGEYVLVGGWLEGELEGVCWSNSTFSGLRSR